MVGSIIMKNVVIFLRDRLFIAGNTVLGYAQISNNKMTSNLLINIYCLLYRFIHSLSLRIADPGIITVIKKYFKKNVTFVDVGANKGIFTLFAVKLVAENGRVFAFEPAPFNIIILQKNVHGYNNVKVIPKAVSARSGTAKFPYPIQTQQLRLNNSQII